MKALSSYGRYGNQEEHDDVVVEGINAAGKTTWCRSHGQSYLIPETGKR
ncbi:hypothetical protein GOC14_30890 [Sinorhizobium meliloti]|nr:hypothetical protein [Sinorhizobium meliloti]